MADAEKLKALGFTDSEIRYSKLKALGFTDEEINPPVAKPVSDGGFETPPAPKPQEEVRGDVAGFAPPPKDKDLVPPPAEPLMTPERAGKIMKGLQVGGEVLAGAGVAPFEMANAALHSIPANVARYAAGGQTLKESANNAASDIWGGVEIFRKPLVHYGIIKEPEQHSVAENLGVKGLPGQVLEGVVEGVAGAGLAKGLSGLAHAAKPSKPNMLAEGEYVPPDVTPESAKPYQGKTYIPDFPGEFGGKVTPERMGELLRESRGLPDGIKGEKILLEQPEKIPLEQPPVKVEEVAAPVAKKTKKQLKAEAKALEEERLYAEEQARAENADMPPAEIPTEEPAPARHAYQRPEAVSEPWVPIDAAPLVEKPVTEVTEPPTVAYDGKRYEITPEAHQKWLEANKEFETSKAQIERLKTGDPETDAALFEEAVSKLARKLKGTRNDIMERQDNGTIAAKEAAPVPAEQSAFIIDGPRSFGKVRVISREGGNAVVEMRNGSRQTINEARLIPTAEEAKKALSQAGGFDPEALAEGVKDVVAWPVGKAKAAASAIYQFGKNLPAAAPGDATALGRAAKALCDKIGEQKGVKEMVAPGALGAEYSVFDESGRMRKVVPGKTIPGTSLRSGEISILSGRKALGEMYRRNVQASKEFEDLHTQFEKRLPEDNNRFVATMQRGEQQPSPDLQLAADAMDAYWKQIASQLKEHGDITTFLEHYAPGMWKKHSSGKPFIANYKLTGPASFLKSKVFADYDQAIAAGYEPISPNPIDLLLFKTTEVNRYLMGKEWLRELKDAGMMMAKKDFPEGKVPEGWRMGDNLPSTYRYLPPKKGVDGPGAIIREPYYFDPDALRLIENFTSPTLWSSGLPGSILRRAQDINNFMNRLQLSLPGFHMAFTTIESNTLANMLSVKNGFDALWYTATGNLPEAAKSIKRVGSNLADSTRSFRPEITRMGEKNAYQNEVSPLGKLAPMTVIDGMEIIEAYKGRKPTGIQHVDDAVAALSNSGMDIAGSFNELGGGHGFKLKRNIEGMKQGHVGDTAAMAWNAPHAALDAITDLTMKKLVPAQRASAVDMIMRDWRSKNPDVPRDSIAFRQEAGRVVTLVDEALGEVTYKRYFYKNKYLNAAQMAMRAPGFTGGTYMLLGRGVGDTVGQAGRLVKNLALRDFKNIPRPELTNRQAYLASLFIGTSLANLSMTMLMETTRGGMSLSDAAKSLTYKDMFAYRTGGKRADGTDARFVLPTYLHSMGYLINEVFRNQDLRPIAAKLSPLIHFGNDALRNRNYRNEQLYGTGEDWHEIGWDLMGAFLSGLEPFGVKNMRKAAEEGGSMATGIPSFFGSTEVSGKQEETPAQRLAHDLLGDNKYSKDKDAIKMAEKVRLLKVHVNSMNPGAIEEVNRAYQTGKIPKDVKDEIIKGADKTKKQKSPDEKLFGRITNARRFLNVYAIANEKERAIMTPILERKLQRLIDKYQGPTKAVYQKTLSAIKKNPRMPKKEAESLADQFSETE